MYEFVSLNKPLKEWYDKNLDEIKEHHFDEFPFLYYGDHLITTFDLNFLKEGCKGIYYYLNFIEGSTDLAKAIMATVYIKDLYEECEDFLSEDLKNKYKIIIPELLDDDNNNSRKLF